MNTKQIGDFYEEQISQYLINLDFVIKERNFRSMYGEIDIIALRNKELHIVEVKKIPSYWDINDIDYKIPYSKVSKIKRTCSYYLAQNCDYKYDIIVFDVACISGKNIVYWEGAF